MSKHLMPLFLDFKQQILKDIEMFNRVRIVLMRNLNDVGERTVNRAL